MKDNVNIDRLFQKASTDPLHTSFDEAKENLVNAVNKKRRRQKYFWSFKIGIIMIAIITGGIIFYMIAFTPTTENISSTVLNKNQIALSSEQPTNREKERKMEFERMTSKDLEQLSLLATAKNDTLMPPSFHRVKLAKLPPPKFIFDLSMDRRKKQDTVEVPELTSDEKAENAKRKRKMIKALAKKSKDVYAFIPSGSTKYKGKVTSVQSFYMQTKEVTNVEYRTFLNDLLIQGRTEDYQKAFPQTGQWTEITNESTLSYENLYHKHPAFDDYPVVNITREGAQLYCKWLTEETRKSKYVQNPNMMNDVRLPQRVEWVFAASNGNHKNIYPWGGASTQNAEECYLVNYMPDSTNYGDDGGMFTVPVGSYHPNDFGLYNMSGNVAEMVYGSTEINTASDLKTIDTKKAGTAGGGWMDTSEALKIEGDDPYANIETGHPNIGFRVVVTVLSTEK